MEELVKTAECLKELIKAIRLIKPTGPTVQKLPQIKAPPQPSLTPAKTAAPKIGTAAGPDSKKDPTKIAEQIKNGSMSTKTQKVMLKTSKNGQWTLESDPPSDI